jgi:inosine triphosphate pyrophosphatase
LFLQVVAILEAGQPLPFKVKAANLDLPELQGEPEEIAKEKCRLAAEQARKRFLPRCRLCLHALASITPCRPC